MQGSTLSFVIKFGVHCLPQVVYPILLLQHYLHNPMSNNSKKAISITRLLCITGYTDGSTDVDNVTLNLRQCLNKQVDSDGGGMTNI